MVRGVWVRKVGMLFQNLKMLVVLCESEKYPSWLEPGGVFIIGAFHS